MAQGGNCHANLEGCAIADILALLTAKPCDWIPASERLPEFKGISPNKISEEVLVCTPEMDYAWIAFCTEDGWRAAGSGDVKLEVACWMPIVLPKPTCKTCNDSGQVPTPPDQTGCFYVKCPKGCKPQATPEDTPELVKELQQLARKAKESKPATPEELVVCNQRRMCDRQCGAKTPHRPEDCESCPFDEQAKCVPPLKRHPTYDDDKTTPEDGVLVAKLEECARYTHPYNSENTRELLKQAASRIAQLGRLRGDDVKVIYGLGKVNDAQEARITELQTENDTYAGQIKQLQASLRSKKEEQDGR